MEETLENLYVYIWDNANVTRSKRGWISYGLPSSVQQQSPSYLFSHVKRFVTYEEAMNALWQRYDIVKKDQQS